MQQGVVAEINAGHQVAGVEADLLRLDKEVVWVAVQDHAADGQDGHKLFWNEFGGVQQVNAQLGLFAHLHQLHAQFPLRELATLNRVPQITAVKVRVLARYFLRFVPCHAVQAELGPPVKLHKTGLTMGIYQLEGVHAKTLHHAVAARQGSVGH